MKLVPGLSKILKPPLIFFIMPTLGPSILFAAGLALGVGTGVLIPRRTKSDVFTPPPPPSGEKRDLSPIKTASGGVVHLQGGFPGPVPDVIKREAYTAAYDRRMRHPSWVRSTPRDVANGRLLNI
jgi:endonuclease G